MQFHTYLNGFLLDLPTIFQATKLHFRGARVFLAVMEDLLAKGMKNAENVCSNKTSFSNPKTTLLFKPVFDFFAAETNCNLLN